jgi:hypothetical protein
MSLIGPLDFTDSIAKSTVDSPSKAFISSFDVQHNVCQETHDERLDSRRSAI